MEIKPATTQQIAAFKAAAAQRYRDLGIKPDNADWVFNRMMQKVGQDLGVIKEAQVSGLGALVGGIGSAAGTASVAIPEAFRGLTNGRGAIPQLGGALGLRPMPQGAADGVRPVSGEELRAGRRSKLVQSKSASADRITKVASAIAKALGRQAKRAGAGETNVTPKVTAPVAAANPVRKTQKPLAKALAYAGKSVGQFVAGKPGDMKPNDVSNAGLRRDPSLLDLKK